MSVPKEIEFSKDDLMFLRDRARSRYLEIDAGAHLPKTGTPITEHERVSLAWLMAVDDLICRKGCGNYISPSLDIPDSDLHTED